MLHTPFFHQSSKEPFGICDCDRVKMELVEETVSLFLRANGVNVRLLRGCGDEKEMNL